MLFPHLLLKLQTFLKSCNKLDPPPELIDQQNLIFIYFPPELAMDLSILV